MKHQPDITDERSGARLYDFLDADGNVADNGQAARLTYVEAAFIYGGDLVKTWKHVPHRPLGGLS